MWGFLKRSLQAVDAQNGNLALHIAAQNGHMGLTSFLLDSRYSLATIALPVCPSTSCHFIKCTDLADLRCQCQCAEFQRPNGFAYECRVCSLSCMHGDHLEKVDAVRHKLTHVR